MIKAQIKLFTVRGVELMDDTVSGGSINSALLAVRKKVKQFRSTKDTNGLDPLRNWSSFEIFLDKSEGRMPSRKEKVADAK